MQNKLSKILALILALVFSASACANNKLDGKIQRVQTETLSESAENIEEIAIGEDNINNVEKRSWIEAVPLRDEYFTPAIPYDVIKMFIPLFEELDKNGVEGIDNRIVTSRCDFYEIEENRGYVVKDYMHIGDITPSICEIYYVPYRDNPRILQSEYGQRFSIALCDAEYLYFVVSDGDLWRVDKNGEIKTYSAFEDYVPVGYLSLEANGDEITIISYGDEDNVVINVRE